MEMTSPRENAAPLAARWESFLALDDDDPRELIDGRLVEVEVPTELHEWVVACLVASLFAWGRTNGGMALGSGYKVRVDDERGVMPDVQFYRKGRVPSAARGLEPRVPDLVVEVVSPSSRQYDRVIKLRWYAQIGAPEYWLVDPEAGTVERLVLAADGYQIAEALTGDAQFAPPSFPGLSIALAELFTLPT